MGLHRAINTQQGGETSPVLVIACGALSHEIQHLKTLNNWAHLHVRCLDADLHNRPQLIPGKLEQAILKNRDQYDHMFAAYADCGTGGDIDRVLDKYGIERLPGAHCYSVFAGESRFTALAEAEPGTFYLTDFLARHFERLIVRGLKLDRHPQLRDAFFGHYRRVVYLSQQANDDALTMAHKAADYLELEFEHLHSGYGELESGLRAQLIATG